MEGQLKFVASIDTTSLQRDAQRASEQIRNIGNQAVNEGTRIESAFKKIGVSIAATFTAQKAMEFVKSIFSVRSEIQSLEISFETLLGSKAKAEALFGEIRKFAVETPMQLKDLASAAQTMLSFNIEESKIMPYLKALGDVSMGDSQRFQALSLAFSQMSSAGKLMGQDLMQMINAGFNPLSVMAEKTGKSISQLKDEMSKGAITAEMVQKAFIDATSEGGKYFEMLKKQSHGLAGAYSNLQGAIDDMLNEIGTSTEGVFATVLEAGTNLVKHYKEVGEAIAELVAVYGTYKAALIAMPVIEQSAATIATIKYIDEANALEKLLTTEQRERISKMNLSKNSAEYAAVVKKEALSNLEAAKAAEKKANANLHGSIKSAAAAKKEYLMSVSLEKQAQKNLLLAEKTGDAKAIEAAKRDVAAAATIREEAATQHLSTQKAVETARTTAATAAESASATAKTVEGAAATADSTAHGVLTMAKNAAAAAAARLNAIIMQNPYMLAAAAVAALAYAIYKLITYKTDLQKAYEDGVKASKEAQSEYAEEKVKIDTLFDALKEAKEGTAEYKQIKDSILAQYGHYLSGLSKEIQSLKDVEGAYKAVTAAALESAKARRIAKLEKKYQDELLDKQEKHYKKAYKIIENKKGKKFAKDHANEIYDAVNNVGGKRFNRKFLAIFDFEGPFGDTINFLTEEEKNAQKTHEEYEASMNALFEGVGLTQEKYTKYKLQQAVGTSSPSTSSTSSKSKNTKHATTSHKKSGKSPEELARERLDALDKMQDSEYQTTREHYERMLKLALDYTQAEIDGMVNGQKKRETQLALNQKKLEIDTKANLNSELQAVINAEKEKFEAREEYKAKTIQGYKKKRFDDGELNLTNFGLNDVINPNKSAFTQSVAKALMKQADTEEVLKLFVQMFGEQTEQAKGELVKAYAGAEFDGGEALKKLVSANLPDDLDMKQLKPDEISRLQQIANDISYASEVQYRFLDTGIFNKEQLGQLQSIIDAYQKLFTQKTENLFSEGLMQEDAAAQRYLSGIGASYETMKEYRRKIDEERAAIAQKFDDELKEEEEKTDSQWKAYSLNDSSPTRKRNALAAFDKELEQRDKFQQLALLQEQSYQAKRDAIIKHYAHEMSNRETEAEREQVKAEREQALSDLDQQWAQRTSTFGKLLGDHAMMTAAQMRELAKDAEDAMNFIINGRWDEEIGKKFGITEAVFNDLLQQFIDSPDKVREFKQAIKSLGDDAKKLDNPLKQLSDAIKDLFSPNKNNDGKPETFARRLESVISTWNKMKESIGFVSGALSSLGDSLDVGVFKGVAEGVDIAVGVMDSAMQGAQAGAAFGPWGAAAGAAIGMISSLSSALSKLHDAKHEKRIAELQNKAESLEKAYEKLDKAISKAYSNSAAQLIRDQNRLLQQRKMIIQQQIAEEEAKKQTDDERIKKWKEELESINETIEDNKQAAIDAIFGEDIKSAIDSFADAYASMFDAGISKAQASKDVVRKMIRNMVVEALKADISAPMEKLRNMLLGFWTDGYIDANEEAILDRYVEDAMSEMQEKYKWANQFLDEDSARTGTSKGIAQASQDSIDELNARMTTVQSHTYLLSENSKLLVANTSAILRSVMNIDNNTQSIDRRIGNLESNITNIRSTLTDIETRGIRIKN